MNKKDKPSLLWFTMKRKGLDVEYPYSKRNWLFRQPWGDFILTMIISILLILVYWFIFFFVPQHIQFASSGILVTDAEASTQHQVSEKDLSNLR